MTATDRRDAAITAALPFIAEHGWSEQALRLGAGEAASLLFPGGAGEMVEAYIDLADRRMVAEAGPLLDTQKRSQRVRTLIATRLKQAAPEKPAVRRAMTVLANPCHAAASVRSLARTVDAIWYAAGDRSADFSWYTKRAILASVYSATLLFWLNEANEHDATLAFLDRRLAGVAQIGRLRRRFSTAA